MGVHALSPLLAACESLSIRRTYAILLVDLTFDDVEATSAEWLALARWWAAQW